MINYIKGNLFTSNSKILVNTVNTVNTVGVMGKGTSKFDNMYKSSDKFVKNLIKKIKQRGHYIGIHPTYNAYNDFEQIKKEKQELEINLDTQITFGREHFLRFEVPTTWQIWKIII